MTSSVSTVKSMLQSLYCMVQGLEQGKSMEDMLEEIGVASLGELKERVEHCLKHPVGFVSVVVVSESDSASVYLFYEEDRPMAEQYFVTTAKELARDAADDEFLDQEDDSEEYQEEKEKYLMYEYREIDKGLSRGFYCPEEGDTSVQIMKPIDGMSRVKS